MWEALRDKRTGRVYYGWWINLVATAGGGIIGAFVTPGSSLLFKPIAADLSMDRTAASVAAAIGTIVGGPAFATGGYLTDKFGPRWVVISGAVLTALGMVLLGQVYSPLSYYLIWGLLITLGNNLAFSVAVDTMLTRWFVRLRGRAFSVRFTIGGVVSLIMTPLLSWLIPTFGWRNTALWWGGASFLLLPVLFIFTKPKPPDQYGWLPDGDDPRIGEVGKNKLNSGRTSKEPDSEIEGDFTLRQALITPAFWLINIAWLIMEACSGFRLHLVPFLTDRGITPVAAGSMLAMMTFFSLPSRIMSGILADRVKKDYLKYLSAGCFFLMAIGMAALLLIPSLMGIYFFLALYGLGSGAFIPIDIMQRSRYFGRKAYGSIQGLPVLMAVPFSFASPIVTGRVFDLTGAYVTVFSVFAALNAVNVLMYCLLRLPKPPSKTPKQV